MSVTAVPLQPVTKGLVPKFWIGILLLVLAGAGLAWLGASGLRYTEIEDGVRYRAFSAGTGEPLGEDDLAETRAELRRGNGQVVGSTDKIVDPQTGEVGVLMPMVIEDTPGPVRVPAAVKRQLREGGVYQILGPASELLGQGRPPGVSASDEVELRLRVVRIDRGGYARMRERMLRQRQSRPPMGPPGGAPGAAPAPALPGGRPGAT